MRSAGLLVVLSAMTAHANSEVGLRELSGFRSRRDQLGGTSPIGALVYWVVSRGSTISSFSFRTGNGPSGTSFQVTLLRDDAPIQTTTMTLAPNAWNTWELPQPETLSGFATSYKLRIEPIGSGPEMEFLNMTNPLLLPPSPGGPGLFTAWVEIIGVNGASIDLGEEASLVVTTQGPTDRRPPPFSCASMDGGVDGNPYVEVSDTLVDADTRATQFFPFLPWDPTSQNSLADLCVHAEIWPPGPGLIFASLSAPGEVKFGSNLRSPRFDCASLAHYLPAQDAGRDLLRIDLESDGGAFRVHGYTSLSAGLPACHPVRLATFSWGVTDEPHWAVRYLPWYNSTVLVNRDRDSDGFGDPATLVEVSHPRPERFGVSNADDCDDSNRNVYPGAAEVCDGVDNDCDGLRDADLTGPLIGDACENNLGVCTGSFSRCEQGTFPKCGARDYGASYEVIETRCDGLDNDCNGNVDDIPLGALCSKQLGVCSGSRTHRCTDAGWAECSIAEYGPSYESAEASCNGLDDDCDGLVDAEDDDLQNIVPCERQVGWCAGAVHSANQCRNAQWEECDVRQYGGHYQPIESSCDGVDNDCDGVVDEGCPTTSCGCSSAPGMVLAVLLAAAIRARRSTRRLHPAPAARSPTTGPS